MVGIPGYDSWRTASPPYCEDGCDQCPDGCNGDGIITPKDAVLWIDREDFFGVIDAAPDSEECDCRCHMSDLDFEDERADSIYEAMRERSGGDGNP